MPDSTDRTRVPGRTSRSELRSIGQVLATLRADFPDISISKIRFLEAEGLIAPERAPSGYRRYREADLERLRYVLAVQRDQYLPLKVIREHLAMMDRGETPPTRDRGTDDAPGGPPPPGQPPRQAVRLTRGELLEASGLTDSALSELERTQIITLRRGTTHYGREALTLAVAARKLSDYGVEGRHLRAFKMSVDREVGLVEQAIAPHVRRAGAGRDVAGEVTQLVVSFHAALVRVAMER